jgi:uridine kinase
MTMAVSPVMRHNQDRPFVIGVCGGSASGKTTVCEILKSSLTTEEISVISCDSFYKALTPAQREAAYSNNYDFDSPSAIDFELMKLAIRNLMNWEDTVCTFSLTWICYSYRTFHATIFLRTLGCPKLRSYLAGMLLLSKEFSSSRTKN